MLERDVALKMMLVDFTAEPAARGRFEREAKAVARLQRLQRAVDQGAGAVLPGRSSILFLQALKMR